jgi:hypothetical protein
VLPLFNRLTPAINPGAIMLSRSQYTYANPTAYSRRLDVPALDVLVVIVITLANHF